MVNNGWEEVHVREGARHSGPLLWASKSPEKGTDSRQQELRGAVKSTTSWGAREGGATTLSSQKFFGPNLGFFAGPPGAWWPLRFPGATWLEEAGRGWHELRGLAGWAHARVEWEWSCCPAELEEAEAFVLWRTGGCLLCSASSLATDVTWPVNNEVWVIEVVCR